jgi:hypothetical protein
MHTRRSFLAAMAALPTAPLVASAHNAQMRHDPPRGVDFCDCPACCRERVTREDHALTCLAIVALSALDLALCRLIDSREDFDDVAADADGLRSVVAFGEVALTGQVIEPDDFDMKGRRLAARRAVLDGPPHVAALLAMHDALDALLDMTEDHCPRWECLACQDADVTVHHVAAGIDLIGGAFRRTADVVVRRQLVTEERKLARLLAREAAGGGMMPHTGRAHAGAAEEAAHCRTLLAILSGKEVPRGAQVQ